MLAAAVKPEAWGRWGRLIVTVMLEATSGAKTLRTPHATSTAFSDARLLDVSVRLTQLGQHLRAVHVVRVPGVVDAQAVGDEHVPVCRIVYRWSEGLPRTVTQDTPWNSIDEIFSCHGPAA